MITLIILGSIPVLFAIVKYFQMLSHHWGINVDDLSIRLLKNDARNDGATITLKVAYTGNVQTIVEEICVKSRLIYVTDTERILAWIYLAIGYFTDDIAGLQTVFGHVNPSSTWIVGAPVYRIENRYVRIPLSILLGVVTVFFFVIYLIPVFWPLLWHGPYRGFQQIAGDEALILHKGATKLTRPFILESGFEQELKLDYSNSAMMPALDNGSPLLDAKIDEVKELPKLVETKLPRVNHFLWKTDVSLHATVKTVGIGQYTYRVKLGTGLVNLTL